MRRPILFFVLGLLAALAAHATSIESRSLRELLKDADHILLGTVVKVDMIDKNGKEITDLTARTGPGLTTSIRLHVQAEKDGWLKTTATNPPTKIIIPLWQMWHYSLRQIKEATEGEPGIFLLAGDHYYPVYPAGFHRAVSEKNEILRLAKVKNKANSRNRLLSPRAKAALGL